MSELQKQALLKKQKILRAKIERQATQNATQAGNTPINNVPEAASRSVDMGGSPTPIIHENRTKSEDKGHESEAACPSPNPFITPTQHTPLPPRKDDHHQTKDTKVRFADPRNQPKARRVDKTDKIVKQNPERDTKVRVSKGVELKSLRQKALQTPPPVLPPIIDTKKKPADSLTQTEIKHEETPKPKTAPQNLSVQSTPNFNVQNVAPQAKSTVEIEASVHVPEKPAIIQPQPIVEAPPKPGSPAKQSIQQPSPQLNTEPISKPVITQPQVKEEFQPPTEPQPQKQKSPMAQIPLQTQISTEPAQKKKQRVLNKIYFKQAEMLKTAVRNMQVAIKHMEYFVELKKQGKLPPQFKQYLNQLRDIL